MISRPPPRGATLREVAALTGAVTLTILVLFAVPAMNSTTPFTDRMGKATYSWSTFLLALHLATGVTSGWLASGLVVLGCAGVVVLFRRDAWAAACLLATVVIQLGAIVVIAPHLGHHFYILARYNVWSLPVLLLFVAAGPGAIPARRGIVSASALVAVAWFSPLWETYRFPNNFTNQERFQLNFVYRRLGEERDRAVREQGSSAYEWLAAQPAGTVVAETPWYHFNSGIIYGDFQRRHRKPVVVVVLDQQNHGWLPLRDARLRMRHFVGEDAGALRARRITYLVVHKSLREEVRHLERHMIPVAAYDLTVPDRRWTMAFGPAVFEDRWVRVYVVSPGPEPRPAAQPLQPSDVLRSGDRR